MHKQNLIHRIQKIDLPENRSAFLWGPRKAGKTTLLKQKFPDACWIDLLDYGYFFHLTRIPGEDLFYSRVGDFQVGDYIFEIGGKSKSKRQIKEKPENSFLVKDDILHGSGNTIPLYLFGFLY